MKYLVMECHEAYAVLMDEESRFFHAANLHYSVGQTVTEPILMQQTGSDTAEAKPAVSNIRRTVMRVTAAAACLLIVGGAGLFGYMQRFHTDAVVVLNSDADIRMYLNKEGKVVKLVSDNEAGAALLEGYDCRRKNKITVAHELLALQKANGTISEGDTVELYISAQSSDDYDEYKTEFESDISKLKLNVSVQDLTVHPEVTAVTESAAEADQPEQNEKPKKPDAASETALPVKPDEPKKPDGKNQPGKVQPPKPDEPQQPPAEPPVKPDEPPVPPASGAHSDIAPEKPDAPDNGAEPKSEKENPEPVKPEKPDAPAAEPPKEDAGLPEPDKQPVHKPEKPAPHPHPDMIAEPPLQ